MKQITVRDQISGYEFMFFDNYQGTILRSFEGFEYPDIRASIDDVAGNYGATYITSKYGRRRFSIQGDLVGDQDDIFVARRQIVTALRQRGQMKLVKFTTYDDLLLQCEAEVVKITNPYTHKVHSFLIEFVAPDWRFYSQTLKSFDIERSSVLAGTAIPTPIPLSLALVTSGEQEDILTNDGNEVSDPIITLFGPGTDYTVRNDTTGEEFEINETLDTVDDYIEVDIKNRTVVKNGVDNMYSSFSGDWWSIHPGDNEIKLIVNADYDINTKVNVQYRDAYGGI